MKKRRLLVVDSVGTADEVYSGLKTQGWLVYPIGSAMVGGYDVIAFLCDVDESNALHKKFWEDAHRRINKGGKIIKLKD